MIFDLHNDLLTSKNNKSFILSQINNDKENKIVYALYKGNNTFCDILNLFNFYKDKVDYFSIENCCYLIDVFFDDLTNVNSKMDRLIKYILKIKPLYLSLTWNYANCFGGGCLSNACLSNLGREFINILNGENIVVDIAHLNKASSLQVCEYADRVICSHTAFDLVFNHKRNIDDDVIKCVIQKNGIIGLDCVGYFLGKEQNSNDFIKHILFFIDKYSSNNLAIGSDFYGSDNLIAQNNYSKLKQILYLLQSEYGVDSKLIEDISYNNVMRYFNL